MKYIIAGLLAFIRGLGVSISWVIAYSFFKLFWIDKQRPWPHWADGASNALTWIIFSAVILFSIFLTRREWARRGNNSQPPKQT